MSNIEHDSLKKIENNHLTTQVLAILRSNKAMEKINFQVGRFAIGTMHYHILAHFIDIGRVHCKVDPSKIPKNAWCAYDPKLNTIIARNSRLIFKDEEENLVHEATHALVDLVGGYNKMKVTSLESETCAYIAGAMYSLAVQSRSSPGVKTTVYSIDKNIKAAADALVRKNGLGTGSTNAGSLISFSPEDIATLQSAIKANPLYERVWSLKTLTDGM